MHITDIGALVIAIGFIVGLVTFRVRRRNKPNCCK
jgi:hypothetical protein